MNRIYFFVNASNGYDRGCIQVVDGENVMERIEQSCKVRGYKDYIVTFCKNSGELDEMEEAFTKSVK